MHLNILMLSNHLALKMLSLIWVTRFIFETAERNIYSYLIYRYARADISKDFAVALDLETTFLKQYVQKLLYWHSFDLLTFDAKITWCFVCVRFCCNFACIFHFCSIDYQFPLLTFLNNLYSGDGITKS